MIPELSLAVRLAVGAGRRERLRAGLTVGASAFGVVVLATVLAAARAETLRLGHDLDRSHEFLLAIVVAFLGMPVLVLLATANRLSASIRDRRLASLRLLGLSPGRTRLVAAFEAGLLGVVGSAVGVVAFFALRPLVGVLSFAGRRYRVADFAPPTWQLLAVVLGVVVLALLVSLAPTSVVTARPLATRAAAPSRRPSPLRFVPMLMGAVLLVDVLGYREDELIGGAQLATVILGIALTGVGLPLAVPVVVRLSADVLARLTKRPAVLVAARRLQLEPAATTRIVAGLLVAVFLVTGARSVITSLERTSQYLDAHHDAYVGPQRIPFSHHSDQPLPSLARLADRPYVRQVVTANTFHASCEGGTGACTTIYVGTCAELEAVLTIRGCRDDRPAWIGSVEQTGESRPPAGDPMRLRPVSGDGLLSLESPSAEIAWRQAEIFPPIQPGLFVPRHHPGAAAFVGPEFRTWIVTADPGREVFDAVLADVEELWPEVGVDYSLPDWDVLEQVAGYRASLWVLSAVAVFVALMAFGIAAVDRAVERRRQVASLRVLGAPSGLARRSQLLQALVPLGLGLPLAGGLGLLAGAGYLAIGGVITYVPWTSVLSLTAAAVGASVLVAVATLAAVGGRLTPELLRRE